VKLHAVVEGPTDTDALPLVLLCSIGTTIDMWAPQRRALAADRPVISIDTRGHGDSPVPSGPYSVADLAGDVRETLDVLGIRRAAVAGVSLGGAVAQRLALDDPDRVAALVLISTSARFGDPQQWHDRAATVREGGTAAIAEATMGRWFAPSFHEAQPAAVELMRTMFESAPTEGYAGCCEALAGWDSRIQLGAITTPTLVVVGAEDPATPPSHARELAEGIPNAELEIVDDAAHLVSLEKFEQVTSWIEEHIAREHAV
jgi:3-oxoadipate enol-lactonase